MAKIPDRAYFERLFDEEHIDHTVYHIVRYVLESDERSTVTITSKVLCYRKDADVSYRSQIVIVPVWMAEESGCFLCESCAEVLVREQAALEEDDGQLVQ